MAKYDIILFENCLPWKTHKVDMLSLGRMLRMHGMRVAIADIYGEENSDEMEGFPVIHLRNLPEVPNFIWGGERFSKLTSTLRMFLFHQKMDNYYRIALPQIYDLADAFYVGSFQERMPLPLMAIDKPFIMWGLRSYRMVWTLKGALRHPASCFYLKRLKKAFVDNPNAILMVSNKEIMEEHCHAGISKQRIFIRPERTVTSLPEDNMELRSSKTSFLTIGQLRPGKQVHRSVESFVDADIPDSEFVIAGKSLGQTEKSIEQAIQGSKNIIRHNRFLTEQEFNECMDSMHYLVLADARDKSAVTNGTMVEALCHLRPFIAPDYPPYSTLVAKYGVGFLFDPNNPESQRQTFVKASQTDSAVFVPKIKEFLKTIIEKDVANQVFCDLKACIAKTKNR